MGKPRFTKTELDLTLKAGDLIQIVTPKIAGVGILKRINNYTIVVDPPPPSEEEPELKKPNETEDEETEPSMDLAATVIIVLEDIDFIFKLIKETK